MLINRVLLTRSFATLLWGGTMELPHWLMASGAVLLVVGLVGSALRRNTEVTSDSGSWERDQPGDAQTLPNPPSEAVAS
jgi:hypothetical protein